MGAIQATLLALGYTPKEIMQIAANIPLKEFNDGFLPGGFSRLKRRFGFFKGENLTKWIEELITAKTGDANITFKQLYDQRFQKNYKELYITGTDLTYRCLRTFSYEKYPNMRVKDALRISFSIPLYFQPVFIDDAGIMHKQAKGETYHMMVDGGLLSNYPINMFDSSRYIDDSADNIYKLNTATLGLLLDKPEQIAYEHQTIYPLSINSLKNYVTSVYQTLIDKPNPDIPSVQRTISISHLNIPGRVRKLPEPLITKLVESGRQGVREYFLPKEALK